MSADGLVVCLDYGYELHDVCLPYLLKFSSQSGISSSFPELNSSHTCVKHEFLQVGMFYHLILSPGLLADRFSVEKRLCSRVLHRALLRMKG